MLTETLSLITVFVMALLLWREHRKRVEAETDRAIMMSAAIGWQEKHAALQAEHRRWSDRDEKGRFVKRERGSSI